MTDRRRAPRPPGDGAPGSASRQERRRAARARRNRLLLGGGVAVSVAVIAAWFPAGDLLHQRHELAAASAELHHLDQQNRALAGRAKQLRTPAAVERIAEQQFDLVPPGTQAYQVLPASGSGGSPALGTAPAGRAPAGAGPHHGGGPAPAPSSFASRVLRTLEFWR